MAINFDEAFTKNYLDTMYPEAPLEIEQPDTMLAAAPTAEPVGQVSVSGFTEPQVVTDVMPENAGLVSKPSGVRVGRAGITPEQSAKAGGLDRPLVALLDTLAGALQGATAQTLGLPGDIRSILDIINKEGAQKYLGDPVMPTTKQMQEILPAVVPQGVANQADREFTAKTFSEVGTFLPAPGVPEAAIQGVKAVGKAIKATKNMPAKEVIQDISGADIPIPKAPKVESKAFKNWFGESKVVDKAGKPITVFHGTKDNIESFMKGQKNKKDAGWLGDGFYFTDNPELASTYAEYLKQGPEGANVMPVYLSLKNPYEATIKDKEFLMMADRRGDKQALKDFTDKLIKDGHDGVVLDYKKQMGVTDPVKEYVVFKPEQIKSVFNKGEFDPNNPNLLLGAGGATVAATQEENK